MTVACGKVTRTVDDWDESSPQKSPAKHLVYFFSWLASAWSLAADCDLVKPGILIWNGTKWTAPRDKHLLF